MERIGYSKSMNQFIIAGLVILLGLGAIFYFEIEADNGAQTLTADIFQLKSEPELVIFNRVAAKGKRTQQIEAVYQLANSNLPEITLQNASFGFKKTDKINALSQWTISNFQVSKGALKWKSLPRLFDGKSYFPNRGHHSRRMVSNDAEFTGYYACAIILIDELAAEAGNPQSVVPCESASPNPPPSITLFAMFDTRTNTLHTLID